MADYATASEVKSQIQMTTNTMDTVIAAMITAASRAIDNFCNRPDGFVAAAAASARTFAGSGNAVQWLDEMAATPTLVEVKDSVTDSSYTAWDSTDWIAGSGDPLHSPDFNHTPYQWIMINPTGNYDHFTSGRYAWRRGFRPEPLQYSRGVPTVRVTARWGYATTVPDGIKQACIIQVSRWLKRGQSGWSDAIAVADTGQLIYQKNLDPDVKLILVTGRYVRPAVG